MTRLTVRAMVAVLVVAGLLVVGLLSAGVGRSSAKPAALSGHCVHEGPITLCYVSF